MTRVIEKVTAFITKKTKEKHQLLLLEHPFAGIQIPAGTVQNQETPVCAVLRETFEETGLTIESRPIPLGSQQTQLPVNEAIILPPVKVFARPDKISFDWIKIQSAVKVEILRKATGYTQIRYLEHDREPNPNHISFQITGWIQDENLAKTIIRHFFHLRFKGETNLQWKVTSDHHTFNLFWVPLENLPMIIPPQDGWLKFLLHSLKEDVRHKRP